MSAADCTLVIPRTGPPIVLHLHTHHLVQSILLKHILTGVPPLHAIFKSKSLLPFRIQRCHLPRILPSPPSHPIIFLPVPDPSSIEYLFHWTYSRTTLHLEHALLNTHIQWQGLARNVEYLGLPADIKVFLGRWYRDCSLLTLPSRIPSPESFDDESDLDSDGADSLSDGYCSPSSQNTDDDMQVDVDHHRGRSRDVKPLIQLCPRFRFCTT